MARGKRRRAKGDLEEPSKGERSMTKAAVTGSNRLGEDMSQGNDEAETSGATYSRVEINSEQGASCCTTDEATMRRLGTTSRVAGEALLTTVAAAATTAAATSAAATSAVCSHQAQLSNCATFVRHALAKRPDQNFAAARLTPV
uniref:Uncharacterized protein n=1 Tax=Peronospora matthiolae TaxID=2874970 RepID=A0AAV1UKH1_9STRA